MKRLILPATLALSVALSGSLMFAQQTAPTPQTAPAQQAAPDAQQTNPEGQRAHHRHHKPDAKRETARLTEKLSLTPDQSTRLEPILADRDQKIAALRTQGLAPQDRRQQMLAIRQNTRQQMESVLTPAQMQQLESMRHGRHGAPDQQPGTAAPGI